MIKSLKHQIGRFPGVKKAYSYLHWKRHIWSDWFYTYVFHNTKRFETPFGFTMIARNYIANRMMMDGIFETEEVELIQKQLTSVDVFVDVGANIGFYSCLARSLGKHVVAIEPQPQNLECLYANLGDNGWNDAEVFPLGLSNKPDLMVLYGASGPSASLVSGWAGYSERFCRIIPVNTLDTIISNRFCEKKLFIKIDVEGAEFNVLQGALQVLSMSPKPIWFVEICLNEFHPSEINPFFEKIFELFWQHGYEARTATSEFVLVTPGDVKQWVLNKRAATSNFNYFFLSP